ncbi:MAG: winged helix-turn-helix domain-containing protein [Rhabdochlamydiaceae bacterium]
MSFEFEKDWMQESEHSRSRFKNRNRLGIVANILTVAKTGAMKTHLMYRANLSYTMLRDYLKFLMDNELLGASNYPDEKVTLYKTTEKGTKFLESYMALKELAAPINDKPFAGRNPTAPVSVQNKQQQKVD